MNEKLNRLIHNLKFNITENLVKFSGEDIIGINPAGELELDPFKMEKLGYVNPFVKFNGTPDQLRQLNSFLKESVAIEFDPEGSSGFIFKADDTNFSNMVWWHDNTSKKTNI
jgi:hypothetical protein